MWAAGTWEGMEGGGEVIVQALPTANIMTAISADMVTPQLSAEISTTLQANLVTPTLTSSIINTAEAEI